MAQLDQKNRKFSQMSVKERHLSIWRWPFWTSRLCAIERALNFDQEPPPPTLSRLKTWVKRSAIPHKIHTIQRIARSMGIRWKDTLKRRKSVFLEGSWGCPGECANYGWGSKVWTQSYYGEKIRASLLTTFFLNEAFISKKRLKSLFSPFWRSSLHF